MTISRGASLGRYQILGELGQGGMATVYKAYQPSLDRTVALKVVRQGFAEDREFMARFEREAKAVARLHHPNIVQVHDYDEQEGRAFLVMEYVEGGTLKQRISELARKGQLLPQPEVARIVAQICEALGYAHGLGVIHRDVKPANVMLTGDGRAVVTDFGIAKILSAQQHTMAGVGLGTPEYMSPEQSQGQPVDARSDIYSLGVLAYELLCGVLPYSAETPFAVAMAHVRDPLPLPSTVNPAVGPATERALLRALAKNPAERFGGATQFGAALARAISEDGRSSAGAPQQPLRAGLTEDSEDDMPTVMPRGSSAAAADRATRIDARVPSLRARRSVVLWIAGAIVLALVSGAVVSNAIGGPSSSVTPAVISGPAEPASSGNAGPAATILPNVVRTPAPPPQAGPAITGTVRQTDGSGVAGSVVAAQTCSSSTSGGTTSTTCAVAAVAGTQPDGAYRLVVPDGTYKLLFGAPVGSRLVSTYWNNRLNAEAADDVIVAGGAVRIDATLASGFRVGGSVTRTDGTTPIAGALVQVLLCASGGSVTTCNEAAGAITGRDGTYTVVVASGTYRLKFNAPDGSSFVTQYWNNKATQGTADDVIVAGADLTRNAALAGTP